MEYIIYLMQLKFPLMNQPLDKISDKEDPSNHEDQWKGKSYAVEVPEERTKPD